MKRIGWTLIAYFLVVQLSFGFSEERQDSCVWSMIRDERGRELAIHYSDGCLELKQGETVKKFYTQEDFSPCLNFEFKGILTKTKNNNWDVRNFWLDDKLLLVTALDDLGRCVLFAIDLVNDKLLTGEQHGNDFMMSRFNKVYFNPQDLTLAIAGDYEEDFNSNEIMTNVYLSKILLGKGIKFEKLLQLPEIDHNTVIAPSKIF